MLEEEFAGNACVCAGVEAHVSVLRVRARAE